MARKRKIERTELDEADRSLYGSFRNAVSSVTSLYSVQKQHMSLAYEAGKRHAGHMLYRWIHSANQQGSVTSIEDVLNHLQESLCAGGAMIASTETEDEIQVSPHRQQTQLEQRPSEHIVLSSEVNPRVAAGGPGPVHSETTAHQNSESSRVAWNYCQSSGQQKELHSCEENDSSVDMNCS